MFKLMNQIATYVSALLIYALLTGCSVAGYQLGKAADYASERSAVIEDLRRLEVRDVVRVTLLDESSVSGIVNHVTMDSLYLSVDESLSAKEMYKHRKDKVLPGSTVGYVAGTLQSIEQVEYSVAGRVILTTLGAIVDGYVLGIAIILYSLSKGGGLSNF